MKKRSLRGSVFFGLSDRPRCDIREQARSHTGFSVDSGCVFTGDQMWERACSRRRSPGRCNSPFVHPRSGAKTDQNRINLYPVHHL